MSATASATDRIFNFSAGPAVLPESVLEQAQKDLWNICDSGIGIMEHSHRGKVFDRVIEEAEADCRKIADISNDYAVLFLQGGASTQFGQIPMNFLSPERVADYPNTGEWTTKAINDAKKFGKVNVPFDGTAENFVRVPTDADLEGQLSSDAAYLHYCSNNTIFGTRYLTPPQTKAPLICDTSSEMFSRPIDINRHALIYAGAQKNLGPSGVTLVIIRRDFAETANPNLMAMMDYRNHIKNGSRYNTPPAFGIYFMGLVFKWILNQGGLESIERRNAAKAQLIYDAIDESEGFYIGHSQPWCRSHMNVTFRLSNPDLESEFLKEAAAQRMDGLKGHRSTGGIRASIYNAFPHAGCEALANLMRDFMARKG
ncbi:MAG: phosphoserine transaminase [Pirellulaceae bacterium]|nr:phosphoserine transaminase [Pirellulaceae bacterium]